jgi:hypothetical protein
MHPSSNTSTETETVIGTVIEMSNSNYIEVVYTDSLGTTHVERCCTQSAYLNRVSELEAAGYTVIN